MASISFAHAEPRQDLVLQPLLAGPKASIEAARTSFSTSVYALPSDYMDVFRGLCEKVFENPSSLLKNDYFLKKAFSILYQNGFNAYYGTRNRLFPLAEKLWQEKEAFEKGVLEEDGQDALVSKLQNFAKMHTVFAVKFTEEAMALNQHSPFTYKQQSYSKTVRCFEDAFWMMYSKASLERQLQIKKQLEESDEQLIYTMTDLGILRFLQDKTIQIELFSREEFAELSAQVDLVDADGLKAVYAKILQEGDLQEGSLELQIYKGIGMARSRLDRRIFNTLIHTLFLDLSKQ